MDDKIKKFLELFDKETQEDGSQPSDSALYLLLKRWENRLPKLDSYFHKAFRQIDITDDGYTDSAIWNLLSGSILFWRLLNEFKEKRV